MKLKAMGLVAGGAYTLNKEVSMRKALTLIVAATLLATCTACSNEGEDGEPKPQCRDMGNSVTVCEFPRPNGGTVECVKTYGLGGGMSCDWND